MTDLFADNPNPGANAPTLSQSGRGLTAGVAGTREIPVYGRADDEWYVEPGWCVDLLLRVERFEGSCWDPACGGGTIPKAFARLGQRCLGSDLRDRGYGTAPIDFLAGDHPVVDCIVCNPPYGHGKTAEAFIRRALTLARRKVAMLVNEKFVYSQQRYALFWHEQTRPTKLWFLSSRPSMPPGELLASGAVEPKGGTMNYLWIVWERGRAPEPPGWLIRDRLGAERRDDGNDRARPDDHPAAASPGDAASTMDHAADGEN